MDVSNMEKNIDMNLINAPSNSYKRGKSLDNVKLFNVISDLTHNPTILCRETLSTTVGNPLIREVGYTILVGTWYEKPDFTACSGFFCSF